LLSDPAALPRRPGGPYPWRPLHFIWLIDGSGSMRVQGKIDALNEAIRAAIPHMQIVARDNPQAAVFVNAIRFGDDARWLVERLSPVADFQWPGVEAGGATSLGEALAMVGEALDGPLIRGRALPPILVLVTDGLPTDDFQAGLTHLLSKPWGQRSKRLVIGLGEDAATAEAQEMFRAFISDEALRPLLAYNPESLMVQVRWVGTAALKTVCSPPSHRAASASQNGKSGVLSTVPEPPDESDIW
jgi:uncharacterized protein YegL